ncbi:hypothetical protein LIER_40273 [Lithospermum erythrorhizon]|uniref:Uncharacterized protein n=1 Tax=Lithospermum erythrorhizon TaxID=34254 RepID=A0AAV3QUF9_LITER
MFSKIGSYLDNPLFANGASSEMARVSYARIYLEVEAKNEIPKFVPLVNECGVEFQHKVECEWRPPVCSHCQEAAVLVDVPTSHVEEVALNECEQDSIVDSIVHHHTPPSDC